MSPQDDSKDFDRLADYTLALEAHLAGLLLETILNGDAFAGFEWVKHDLLDKDGSAVARHREMKSRYSAMSYYAMTCRPMGWMSILKRTLQHAPRWLTGFSLKPLRRFACNHISCHLTKPVCGPLVVSVGVQQICGVTLEPVWTQIDEDFTIEFQPADILAQFVIPG